MIILGIDTVFHTASVAIIKDNKVITNLVSKKSISKSRSSLIDFSFNNVSSIGALIKEALEVAKIDIKQVSLISVTNRGNLLSSVIVGVAAANTLGSIYNIPVIGVDHHEAHIYSNWIENKKQKFKFPILAFSASGAHTSLSLIKGESGYVEIFNSKGVAKDSSEKPLFVGVGTLFSDVSLFLKLREINEKGDDGLLISELAKKGDYFKYDFYKNCPDINFDFWDFLKIREYVIDSVKNILRKNHNNEVVKCDIAASFEMFLVKMLSEKILKTAKKYKINEVHFVGGVASNNTLRKYLKLELEKKNIIIRFPNKEYCVDNAAMVANLGKIRFDSNKKYRKTNVEVESDLTIDKMAIEQFFKSNNN
jgi:N6-L-threonylcarbamoyladenine synthase